MGVHNDYFTKFTQSIQNQLEGIIENNVNGI